jgi:hypothetical protein
MLEKCRGRWTFLCANETLSSSEDRGAQPTDCRSPQGTCQGEFFQAGTDGGRVISAYAGMRKSVKLAET